MLAPRRGCLVYSNVCCDVRKRWFLAWNQNKHITYYIFHIQYTNPKIIIGLLYICSHFVWWHQLNHCSALVRNLPTSILVRASVSLLTFHTWAILASLFFKNFEYCRLQNFSISTLSCLGDSSVLRDMVERSCQTALKLLSSSLKKRYL